MIVSTNMVLWKTKDSALGRPLGDLTIGVPFAVSSRTVFEVIKPVWKTLAELLQHTEDNNINKYLQVMQRTFGVFSNCEGLPVRRRDMVLRTDQICNSEPPTLL